MTAALIWYIFLLSWRTDYVSSLRLSQDQILIIGLEVVRKNSHLVRHLIMVRLLHVFRQMEEDIVFWQVERGPMSTV